MSSENPRTLLYFNKFPKSHAGTNNAIHNYFNQPKPKLIDNFLHPNTLYQPLHSPSQSQIKALSNLVEGCGLTRHQKLYLSQPISDHTHQISIQSLFNHYQQYLSKSHQIKTIIQKGVALNKIIKPFLALLKQISNNPAYLSLLKEGKTQTVFQIFNQSEAQKSNLPTEDQGQLYFQLLADHIEKFQNQNSNSEAMFNALNFDEEKYEKQEIEEALKKSQKANQKLNQKSSKKKKFEQISKKISDISPQSLSFELELLKEKADKILYDRK